ncbi:MAG: hypothetical protein WCT02_03725 [Candidatus Paceibacterota bacterium]
MALITEMAKALWEVWKEMFAIFMGIFPRAVSFVFWILCGIIIVPCIFIAGQIYPKWQEWGENI